MKYNQIIKNKKTESFELQPVTCKWPSKKQWASFFNFFCFSKVTKYYLDIKHFLRFRSESYF